MRDFFVINFCRLFVLEVFLKGFQQIKTGVTDKVYLFEDKFNGTLFGSS